MAALNKILGTALAMALAGGVCATAAFDGEVTD